MWDTLARAHEGTSDVKKANANIATFQFEIFKMEPHETSKQMFGRFKTITNSLKGLQNVVSMFEEAFLRTPKVISIEEAKNLTTLRMDKLLGSMKFIEVKLCNQDVEFKRGKNTALMAKRKESAKKK